MTAAIHPVKYQRAGSKSRSESRWSKMTSKSSTIAFKMLLVVDNRYADEHADSHNVTFMTKSHIRPDDEQHKGNVSYHQKLLVAASNQETRSQNMRVAFGS